MLKNPLKPIEIRSTSTYELHTPENIIRMHGAEPWKLMLTTVTYQD